MSENTNIAWTDHTFNCWWGCTKVSPGCDNCYAEAFDKRVGGSHWGKGQPRRTFGEKYWAEPLKWDRDAEKAGTRHLVFCASMADVMDDEAPEGEREKLWTLIDQTPNLIWQLLTKRPQRYERYLPAKFRFGNVWLGTTAENQEFYNLRWPLLAAACDKWNLTSFVSYEPALGPLTMTDFPIWPRWIIFGGESGNNRRPAQEVWLRDLKKEIDTFMPWCSLFVKQMSARTPNQGKLLIPTDMLVQEFPQ
jgi:protein gp37